MEDAGNREGEVEVAKILMDASHMRRTIVRIAHEVAENVESMEVLALVGIHRRGVEIAERLAAQLEETYGVRQDTGAIDITSTETMWTRARRSTVTSSPSFTPVRFRLICRAGSWFSWMTSCTRGAPSERLSMP